MAVNLFRVTFVHRTMVFSGQPYSGVPVSSTPWHSSSCYERRMCYHLESSRHFHCLVGISEVSYAEESDLFPYIAPMYVASPQFFCFWDYYWIANPYSLSLHFMVTSVDCIIELDHFQSHYSFVIFSCFCSAWDHCQCNKKCPCSLVRYVS